MQTGGDAHNPLHPDVEGTERMADEGGPAVPGAPVTHGQVASEHWEYSDAEASLAHIASVFVQAIYFVFGIIEGLLAIRLAFRLLGANQQNGFVESIYGITGPFVQPFVGIFGTPASGGYVLEPHTILAMVIYALIAYLLASLVRLVLHPHHGGSQFHRETHVYR